jgi:hypothetical protein
VSDLSDLTDAQIAALASQQEWQQGGVKIASPQGLTVPVPGTIPTSSPISGMSEGQQFLAGIGQGVYNVGRHAANLVGLVSDADLAKAREQDAPLLSQGAGRGGSLVGQALTIAPAAMGGEALAGGLGLSAAAHPILAGIAEGAGTGYLMGDPGQKGASALVGGVTGGALPTLGSVAGRAVYGAPKTADAQLLLNRGVPLTPGQMSPGGTANLIEQSAESVPLVGPMVAISRENAEQHFGRAVMEQGAAPGTQIRPSSNVSDMYDQAAASWDPVHAQVHGYPVAPAIVQGQQQIPLSTVFQQASQVPGLSQQRQASINAWLQARLQALPAYAMSEDYIGANGVRSAIRAQQRNLLNSTDVDAPLIRQAYENAENGVTGALNSQLPPGAAQTLQDADRGYAQLKVIGNAVTKAGDQLSGLTPQKLSQAIRSATDQGAYARGGGGDLRDLARAGTSVFQTVAPPTGARVLTAGAAGALGYASPHVALPIMGAAGAGAFLGAATPLGRSLAAGTTAPQTAAQRLVAALTQSTSPGQRQLAAATARAALNRAGPTYISPLVQQTADAARLRAQQVLGPQVPQP